MESLVQVLAGLLLIGVAFCADFVLGNPFHFGYVQWSLVSLGLLSLVLGRAYRPNLVNRARSIVVNASIALSVAVLCVFLAEVFFRSIDYDFNRQAQAREKLPPFLRQPIEPTGEVYFRRSGPQQWTGQVLRAYSDLVRFDPNPYLDEPVVTVTYDHNGFRNPPGFADWEIVVAGDSFVELGNLPDDALFTTLMQTGLDTKVLNLGTSRTSLLTYLSYIRAFGLTDSVKHVLVVFYEGNDLLGLVAEMRAWRHWRQTGERPDRAFKPQSSLARAAKQELFRLYARYIGPPEPGVDDPRIQVAGLFHGANGDVPVTFAEIPPSSAEVDEATRSALDQFFSDYAALARENRVTASLAYMPAKLRILRNHVSFAEHAAVRSWRPTDLAEVMARYCGKYGVDFIDLTPALARETKEKRVLLYNPIVDNHLTQRGAQVVGEVLAQHYEALMN